MAGANAVAPGGAFHLAFGRIPRPAGKVASHQAGLARFQPQQDIRKGLQPATPLAHPIPIAGGRHVEPSAVHRRRGSGGEVPPVGIARRTTGVAQQLFGGKTDELPGVKSRGEQGRIGRDVGVVVRAGRRGISHGVVRETPQVGTKRQTGEPGVAKGTGDVFALRERIERRQIPPTEHVLVREGEDPRYFKIKGHPPLARRHLEHTRGQGKRAWNEIEPQFRPRPERQNPSANRSRRRRLLDRNPQHAVVGRVDDQWESDQARRPGRIRHGQHVDHGTIEVKRHAKRGDFSGLERLRAAPVHVEGEPVLAQVERIVPLDLGHRPDAGVGDPASGDLDRTAARLRGHAPTIPHHHRERPLRVRRGEQIAPRAITVVGIPAEMGDPRELAIEPHAKHRRAKLHDVPVHRDMQAVRAGPFMAETKSFVAM